MAVRVATSGDKARRANLKYNTAPLAGRPQDPTLEQQAAAIAKKKAMAKGEEFAMPMLEDTWTKIKTAFSPASTATSAAPIAEGATMAEVAAGAGGNAIGTVGTGLTEAAAANAATGAAGSGMMAGLGAVAPWLIGGYFGGKALGLFNRGGYVNGPLSKVRYKKSGGPVNEEIEVSYGGPLSKGV